MSINESNCRLIPKLAFVSAMLMSCGGFAGDAAATWTLQLKDDVTIQSALVRLGDVVDPVNVPEATWQQLRRITVGLVPTDGRPLRLMRFRLSQSLSDSPLVTAPIQWIGPESLNVKASVVAKDNGGTMPSGVQQVAATSAASSVVPVSFEMNTQKLPLYNQRLIQRVVEQAMEAASEVFDYEVDWNRLPVGETLGVAKYERVAVPETITEGLARFVLTAEVAGKQREIPVHVQITVRPRGIAATRNLSRGQIISAADLEWKAIDRGRSEQDLVTDMQTLIGQEVRRNVLSGRLVNAADVGSPILVRRNDLIEIRVVGGAVVVRTSGKALSEGSQGDLIQIETIQDRKRLLGRVTGSSQVEIVTRAPQVR